MSNVRASQNSSKDLKRLESTSKVLLADFGRIEATVFGINAPDNPIPEEYSQQPSQVRVCFADCDKEDIYAVFKDHEIIVHRSRCKYVKISIFVTKNTFKVEAKGLQVNFIKTEFDNRTHKVRKEISLTEMCVPGVGIEISGFKVDPLNVVIYRDKELDVTRSISPLASGDFEGWFEKSEDFFYLIDLYNEYRSTLMSDVALRDYSLTQFVTLLDYLDADHFGNLDPKGRASFKIRADSSYRFYLKKITNDPNQEGNSTQGNGENSASAVNPIINEVMRGLEAYRHVTCIYVFCTIWYLTKNSMAMR